MYIFPITFIWNTFKWLTLQVKNSSRKQCWLLKHDPTDTELDRTIGRPFPAIDICVNFGKVTNPFLDFPTCK